MALTSGPTPWWQLPGQNPNLSNLSKSSPAGYQYDPVQMRYVETTQSAPTALADKQRLQGMQDTLFSNEQADRTMGINNEERAYQDRKQVSDRLLGSLNGLQGMLSSSFSTGGIGGGGNVNIPAPTIQMPTPNVTSGGGNSQPLPSVSYDGGNMGTPEVDTALGAKQNAAFGAAKARAGAMGRSAISSTASELAGRGLSTGGGAFARRVSDRVAAATNPLSDINVAQLGENAANARQNANLKADAAKTAYEGGIAQRGQDLTGQNEAANRTLTESEGRNNRAYSAAASNASMQQNAALESARINAQAQLQKQMALQSLLTNAMTGLNGALGKLY